MAAILNSVRGRVRQCRTMSTVSYPSIVWSKMWRWKLKSQRYLKPFISYCRFRFYGRHLGFVVGGDVELFRRWHHCKVVKPVPENWGCKFAPPPPLQVALQNRLRCSRVKLLNCGFTELDISVGLFICHKVATRQCLMIVKSGWTKPESGLQVMLSGQS